MSFMDFSSWPREQEQSFVVYEQRAAESKKKAFTIGAICGLTWFFIMVGVYFGVEPEHKDLTKGMNMNNLTKKSKKASAAEAAPTPEAPKAEEKPAEPAEKPAEPAAEGGEAAEAAEAEDKTE